MLVSASRGQHEGIERRDYEMRAPIIVGVENAANATAIVEVAARLAGALGRRLVVVHAAPDPPTFPYGDQWQREVQRRHARQQAHRLLDRIVAVLPSAHVQTRVLLGDAQPALVSVSREEQAALVVVGSSGGGLLAAARTGSSAAALADACGCPVMVVPPSAWMPMPQPGGSIVAGVDGSDESMPALELAHHLAQQLQLELVPVFADQAGAWPDVPAGVVVESGDARYALNQRVAEHNGQLIVMGSRGRGPITSLVLGSASGALAASAAVPVLIVPPDTPIDRLIDTFSGRVSSDIARSRPAQRLTA
jgi:nucleotide-binding universal stress UspA family protein